MVKRKSNGKFRIGDQVTVSRMHGNGCRKLCSGTVAFFRPDDTRPGVRLDKRHPEAHSLDGNCDNEYGWFFSDDELVLVHRNVKRLRKQKPISVPSTGKYMEEMGL